MKMVPVQIPYEMLLEAISRLDDDHKQSLYLLLGQQLGEQAEKPTFVEGSRQQALQQLGQTVERILTETGMTEDELVSHLLDE